MISDNFLLHASQVLYCISIDGDASLLPDKPAMRNSSVKRLHAHSSCGCHTCCQRDCGICTNCLDKPKFGGDGLRKKSCQTRGDCRRVDPPLATIPSPIDTAQKYFAAYAVNWPVATFVPIAEGPRRTPTPGMFDDYEEDVHTRTPTPSAFDHLGHLLS